MRVEPTRRGFLTATGLLALAGCSSGGSGGGRPTGASQNGGVTPTHNSYGSDPSQFGELTKPEGTSRGFVVIIHGGFWRAEYGLSLGRPLAEDLAARGYTCWNLEYRRVGDGGGWPGTLDDVAAGIDHLTTLGANPSSKVIAVGHSAGGQLAVWAAGRSKLAAGSPGADPKITLAGVVSQAGVLDMVTAADTGVGGTAVQDLLGGSPTAVPQRYRVADPIQAVPLTVPVLCVHATGDANVPYAQSTAYVAAATRAGAQAALHTVPGDHFTLIDTSTPAWAAARDAVPDLLEGRLPT